MRVRRVLSLASLVLGVLSAARCSCENEVAVPPPPIGSGDPVEQPDAGDLNQLDAGPVVCEDDEHEDNDERGAAVAVAGSIDGVACGDDDDWFSVESAPGCNVLAEMTQTGSSAGDGSPARGDVDMLLFDPDGQLVGSSATADPVEAVNAPATKQGAYAVRLRPGSRDDVAYTLTLTSTCPEDLTCPADDALEDNDDATGPAVLNEGVAHDGILCGLDQDWFFAPVPVGCIADARIDFVDDTGDIDLELFLADGVTRVANSAGTGDQERITKVVTEGGMRYRAFFFAAAEANRYRFVVEQICAGEIACPGDDPFEPNDERGQAKRLFAGVDEVIGTICGNDDFYDLIPQQGCTLHATLDFSGVEGDLDLELVRANNGDQLALSNGTDDDEQIDFVAPDADRVALRVFGFNGATNAYRLRVDTTCP